MTYVELHCHSAYSFLDGASLPEELAARAAELGYPALALTDHDGVYGSLEFAHAAKDLGVRPITGAEVTLDEAAAHVTLLVETSRGLREPLPDPHRGARGHPRAGPRGSASCSLPPSRRPRRSSSSSEGPRLPLRLRAQRPRRARPERRPPGSRAPSAASASSSSCSARTSAATRGATRALRDLAEHLGVATVATGNVHAHAPRRTLLQDTLVAIRCRTSLDGCEQERRGNRESILRAPARWPSASPASTPPPPPAPSRSRSASQFDLTEELGYRYPDFSDGDEPAIRQLAEICNDAFADRYPPSDSAARRGRALGSRASSR